MHSHDGTVLLARARQASLKNVYRQWMGYLAVPVTRYHPAGMAAGRGHCRPPQHGPQKDILMFMHYCVLVGHTPVFEHHDRDMAMVVYREWCRHHHNPTSRAHDHCISINRDGYTMDYYHRDAAAVGV